MSTQRSHRAVDKFILSVFGTQLENTSRHVNKEKT